jgi:hypothetical protein
MEINVRARREITQFTVTLRTLLFAGIKFSN